ncbi:Retron-type RNA-directed DNA polymerase [hydrothermal vent metagenome]|uniref:Retron-type RNA-directed DNA polymerase n=1 Tax=hydrothermal vent metagenome TaxID=652676 RepID=A0A3B1E233_9ZZZZ
MGLIRFILGLFGWENNSRSVSSPRKKSRLPKPRVKLSPQNRQPNKPVYKESLQEVSGRPYLFARRNPLTGKYFDLIQGGDFEKLSARQLPFFETPESIANWLQIPAGQLAWLTHRFEEGHRSDQVKKSHYHYRWLKKRSDGFRLLESPKQLLKQVQHQILREILDKIPAHEAAHGFVKNRSIVTNAQPHVGQRVIIKFDLENFYATISFNRVVAIFRGMGYCREAAIWLTRLTTTAVPRTFPLPSMLNFDVLEPYLNRHLPQGAPTSPALANLSAYSLDVRLDGMANAYHVNYTRYADDLTFSGSDRLLSGLRTFIPLVTQIACKEKFGMNLNKRKVIRNSQRQQVTGVVVNEQINVSRKEYDLLKAILTNCLRQGAATQNRNNHPDFSAHLRGRIAHVKQLNITKGQKLEILFKKIHF